MLTAGSPAPEIDSADLAGVPVRLSRLVEQGGRVLVAFFKVSCPTCQYTFPFLQRFAEHGMTVIGVSQDDAAATKAFGERFEISFSLWLDTKSAGYKASNAFQITHVPSIFLVGPDRRIELASDGFSRDDLQAIGQRFGFVPFLPGESIPEFRPG